MKHILGLLLLTCTLASTGSANEIGLDWPRDITNPKGTVTVYQPQLESFEGNLLTGLAAVSVQLKDRQEPAYGAVWLEARVETDRNNRTVDVVDVKVPEVRFPEATPEQIEKLSGLIADHFTGAHLTLSLDQLLTSLEMLESSEQETPLQTRPPRIVFVTTPTALISIDGEPQLRPSDSDSSVLRVLNSPAFIALDTGSATYFLRGGGRWYSANKLDGPWASAAVPSANIAKVAESVPATAVSADEVEPAILVVTEPTELIETEGDPTFTPVKGTDLLTVGNTDRDVFLHIASNKRYLLLSGRWYAADGFDGPWTYVRSDALPADFGKIPEDSEVGDVLAFVAGTDLAREAVLDTAIPQTAAIQRESAALTVTYEGTPQFQVVENSTVRYAINTTYSVVQVGGKFYCCHNGVWFDAPTPSGPWSLCVAVPEPIYLLPPSCPVYHIRYVRVYSYTPKVVYVGYTPGYVGCYVHHGTVVYGTGYVHPGYCGATLWVPRPRTFGIAVGYNASTGNWGVAAGVAGPYGFVGVGHASGGWWGEGHDHWGDRDIDIDIDQDINKKNTTKNKFESNRNSNNVYDRRDDLANRERPGRGEEGRRPGDGIRPEGGRRPEDGRRPEGGRRPEEGLRPDGSRRPTAGTLPAGGNRPNDHFTDRNGSVYRKGQDGSWQKREGGSWKSLGRPAKEGASPRSGGASPRSGGEATPRPTGSGTPTSRRTGTPQRAGSGAAGTTPSRTPQRSSSRQPSSSRRTPSSYQSKDLNRMQDSRNRGAQRTRNSAASRSRGGRSGGGRRGGGRRR